MGPFGVGNPESCFTLLHARIGEAERVGKTRCHFSLKKRIKAVAFRVADQPLGQVLLEVQGRTVHIAGKLRADGWMGQERVEFTVDDAAAAAG